VSDDDAQEGKGSEGIYFFEYEGQVVKNLSRGMRVVSVLQLVAAVQIAAVIVLILAKITAKSAVIQLVAGLPVLALGVYVVVAAIGGIILGSGSKAFSESVKKMDTNLLGRGFRKVRSYLILTGVVTIVGIAITVIGFLGIQAFYLFR
jgi:hypothetical protein